MSKIKLTEVEIIENARSTRQWLETTEGKAAIKQASDRVKRVSTKFNDEGRIDPSVLRKQFTL